MAHDIAGVFDKFAIYGDFISAAPYGSGHINDTYKVVSDQAGTIVHYIFQRINTNIFKEPVGLMDNIRRVTSHICARARGRKDASRQSLCIVQGKDLKPFVVDADGNYWRGYLFIEKAQTYDVIKNAEQAFEVARSFGNFQKELVDIPGGRLFETIPDFHNTPKRLEALEAAIKADMKGRVKDVAAEIDFVMSRRGEVSKLVDLNAAGQIPERITHNDTKLNNVMIDDASGNGICVIDLDTVMPGLVHYDFGDMVRTSTSPSMEDEKDLSRVYMQFNMFEALLRGYLESAGNFLNPVERENLPFSGKLITLEIGIRFLTDYLSGDVYFKIHRPEHNLDRCRTQFKLVSSIEEQMPQMMALLNSIQ
jgi:hypothetical protein